MDPEMMKQAMEAMKHLPPDQLQQMMGGVTPEMMQQAQRMASQMSPDDWKRAQEQMKGMSPEQMQQQAAAAQQQFGAQQKYTLDASTLLKNEGNTLHSAGKYSEALEKYERAKQNVDGLTLPGAAELRKACTLNLSSCYLNLKRWADCVAQCSEVLQGEADSLKALYRRGQAYMGQGSWAEAVEDLGRAAKLCPASDPAQLTLIREKLQDAKDALSMQRAAAARVGDKAASTVGAATEAAASSAQAASAGQSEGKPQVQRGGKEEDGAVEDVAEAHTQPSTSAAATPIAGLDTPLTAASSASSSTQLSAHSTQQLASAAMAAAGGSGAGMTPEAMRAAADMMRSDPNWAKQVDAMMSGMSDAQLEELATKFGAPAGAKLSSDQIRAARESLKTLKPEQLEKFAQMQSAVPPDLAARVRANPHDPEALAQSVAMMRNNPDMVSMAADMMANMTPAQLADMARQAGMPAGSAFTPELAKAAAESFKSMSPEDMKRMTEMAASMRAPTHAAAFAPTSSSAPAASSSSLPAAAGIGSASTAVAPASQSGVGAMPGVGGMPPITPEMAKMASEMMRSMPPETLAAMSSSMGASGMAGAGGVPTITPDMAKMAADMMSKMSPEDMQRMTAMMGGGGLGAGMPAMPPGGLGGMDAMAKMGADPAMMDSAMKMMRGMDPAALADMLAASGMVKDRLQAEAMARQVQNMSDTQLKLMTKAATTLQAGARVLQKARAFVVSRTALIIAICILLLAYLLQRWGIM